MASVGCNDNTTNVTSVGNELATGLSVGFGVSLLLNVILLCAIVLVVAVCSMNSKKSAGELNLITRTETTELSFTHDNKTEA